MSPPSDDWELGSRGLHRYRNRILNSAMSQRLNAYRRPDGRVGVRNHLLILPSCGCACHVAESIAARVPGAVVAKHQHGCAQIPEDAELTRRTLAGIARNPNVGAALVVGLGCETVSADSITERAASTGKRIEPIIIQQCGGTTKAIETGHERARAMLEQISRLQREPCSAEALVVGLECGGSDAYSGLSANPALGVASDLIVAHGGTVILSETTELIGAEHLLAERGCNPAARQQILDLVAEREQMALDLGIDIGAANPSPGNIAGGITTIEEKSLGCIHKAGTTQVREVLRFAEEPTQKGLVIMDTPGNDIESVSGEAAGGAQLIIFTTGRGNPVGCVVAPVIKISTNTQTYENMKENIDINAGSVVDGERTIQELGEEIFQQILDVATGQETSAERLGHREFAINRLAPTF